MRQDDNRPDSFFDHSHIPLAKKGKKVLTFWQIVGAAIILFVFFALLAVYAPAQEPAPATTTAPAAEPAAPAVAPTPAPTRNTTMAEDEQRLRANANQPKLTTLQAAQMKIIALEKENTSLRDEVTKMQEYALQTDIAKSNPGFHWVRTPDGKSDFVPNGKENAARPGAGQARPGMHDMSNRPKLGPDGKPLKINPSTLETIPPTAK